MLNINEIKDLILFAKANGVLVLKVGEVEMQLVPPLPEQVDLEKILGSPSQIELEKLMTYSA